MLKENEINKKSDNIDKKANILSIEMSKFKYTITTEMINMPLNRMKKIIRMMGFTNEQTNNIIESVKKDLVGKEMHKGYNFHELIKEAFTKAITNSVEEMKR